MFKEIAIGIISTVVGGLILFFTQERIKEGPKASNKDEKSIRNSLKTLRKDKRKGNPNLTFQPTNNFNQKTPDGISKIWRIYRKITMSAIVIIFAILFFGIYLGLYEPGFLVSIGISEKWLYSIEESIDNIGPGLFGILMLMMLPGAISYFSNQAKK